MLQPIILPQSHGWDTPAEVEAFACACMELCGLQGWSFAWDRAVRRLGCCKMRQRTLSLSRYFVEAYLQRDCGLIRNTILHELAHALAWERHNERGHGAAWHYWCAVLGIPDEKSVCKCEDFTPDRLRRQPKYALCHCETREIFRYYSRMPKMSARKLKSCYIPGKKDHTLGKLCIISLDFEENNSKNLQNSKKNSK